MFERIQHIGKVVGNNNIIINGDIVEGNAALTRIANQLLRQELEILTQEARERMQDSIDKCVETVLERIAGQSIMEKLSEFSNPSTQFAFYSTLKGFSSSETAEQQDMLVDAFIERIQTVWDSSEKMIIDSALDVLPRLNPTMLATLALMQLRHQFTNAVFGAMLDVYFTSLTPLVEQMSAITHLDFEYLKQERLIQPLPGIQRFVTLEQYMLARYDLFFRHPLSDGAYKQYCEQYPVAQEAVTDSPARACMMWIDSTRNNVISFCCPSSSLLKRTLQERHQEYIIPHVDTLMNMMPPFSEDELRGYFARLSPSWDKAFNLFSSDDFTQYALSIAGNYIGGKILSRAVKCIPLPLDNYNHPISL